MHHRFINKKEEKSTMSKENIVSVLDPRGQPSGIFGRAMEEAMGNILDPHAQPVIKQENMANMHMAKRLDSLDGKTIFLVNTGFAGAGEFMEELTAWFAKNMPKVKIENRRTKGTFSDDPELWPVIKKDGHAAIVGVGG
jgi:hypothetical protein